jgi:hypothetical protein
VFVPQAERPINYNVAVRVRNKPTPLVLNVKGEGYALQPSLLLELPDDSSLEMSPLGINTLDYGQVSCPRCHAVSAATSIVRILCAPVSCACC